MRFRALLRGLTRRSALDRELDEELDSFVEILTAEKVKEGVDPEEARRQARRELGGRESLKDAVRDRRVGEPFLVCLQDLRFGLRMISRSPAFTAAVALTLALGIGATTAVFSVTHAVLMQSLPYPDSDRLVFLWTHGREGRKPFSPPDFVDLSEQMRSLEVSTAIQGDGLVTLSLGSGAEPVRMRDVTPSFLSVYGVEPHLGRGFRPEDDYPIDFETWDDPNASLPTGVVMISYELFRDRFGGDPGVLGKIVHLDLHPYEIVGVTPPGFRTLIPDDGDYTVNADIWSLSRMDFPRMPRDVSFLRAVGRLRPHASLESAQAEASVFAERQRALHRIHRESGFSIEVVPLRQSLSEEHGSTLWLLFGAVGLVLLIACANLANLQLCRLLDRQKELAVRSALGAGRSRLVRQMLTESLLYSVLGLLGGIALARVLVQVFVRLSPPSLPRTDEIGIDVTVLGFAIGASVLSGLLLGALPAVRFSHPGSLASLRMSSRESTDLGERRWDGLLVVGEIALSVMLVIGTALLLRSLATLLQVDPGFDASRVLTAEMSLSSRRYPRYPSPDARVRFARRACERIREIPGVDSAALALVVPLSRQDAGHTYATDAMGAGRATFPPAKYRPVTPGYFEAVGTRLVSGRDFDWTDLELGRLVTVVDEALAAKAWPGEDPLGKRLRIEVWSTRNGPIHLEPLWTEVVGVVEEVRSAALDRADGETVYLPYSLYAVSELSLLVRSDAEPAFLTERIRDTFSRIDPDLAVFNFRVMDEWVAESLAPRRFALTLLTAFGIAGLSLALVGIYGVLASSVNLRRRELGIRLALGARPAEVLRLVMARGARLTAVGLVLGLVGASGLARLLSRQLYGVGPNDLLVFTSVAATIVLVSLAASYVPARRAARIDPMKILRLE